MREGIDTFNMEPHAFAKVQEVRPGRYEVTIDLDEHGQYVETVKGRNNYNAAEKVLANAKKYYYTAPVRNKPSSYLEEV